MTELWGIDELSEYLGIPKQTIYKWRGRKYGPPGRRVGKHLKYDPAEAKAWFNSLPVEVA